MNLQKLKRLEDKLSDLTLKIVLKNIIISAQKLQIKALNEKLRHAITQGSEQKDT